MFDTIKEILYEVTGKSNLALETDFQEDLGLNSFDIMNIVCAFEERFDMSIPVRDVWKLHQVKDVLTYMKERGFE
ncbi:Acyl carrier protein [bioreactor metagenome]|uniref:Acyl carrier protein n=1 Tax=bioreactor metagenome TaxID=1076179 RepID=A0A645G7Q6_9ZZZZ